jgi:REP element-mobilizing transposase RayT
MPRKARLEFDGAVYHLLDRGDRREAIFRDDRDREMFLTTVGRVCERTGWRVHAWVLMTNHYHLLNLPTTSAFPATCPEIVKGTRRLPRIKPCGMRIAILISLSGNEKVKPSGRFAWYISRYA